MRFICETLFDITATGVTGHFKSARVPFQDRTGKTITNYISWNSARNQQRNWETITQIISMRTQLFDLTDPVYNNKFWTFEFETESDGVFGPTDNPVSLLKDDAEGVPMIVADRNELESVLITHGPKQNIWFAALTINN